MNNIKNILVTGGLGFIGFNAIQLWKKIRPNYNYIVVDLETYASSFKIEDKVQWLRNNNILLFKADIKDQFSIESLITQYKIDTIVNFAAESHVDNSIKEPNKFFETNVMGVVSLLNIANKFNIRLHQISTDEVYGETTPDSWVDVYASENSRYTIYFDPSELRLNPSSPYSSSKASADMISLSYHRTFNTNVTISRCTNNFGPYQHPEKLIGTVISKALKDEQIPVYGTGDNKRHWVFVDTHNLAIMDILEHGKSGEIYTIGSDESNWISNMRLVKMMLKLMNKPMSLIKKVDDRPGHDYSYFLRQYSLYKGIEKRDFKTDLKATIEWYKENLK